VAFSLVGARDEGVKRAILFTGEDNLPAIAAYRALGFERIGDFRCCCSSDAGFYTAQRVTW
jgi:RimJ/RimL family protein N-acetyltransferase